MSYIQYRRSKQFDRQLFPSVSEAEIDAEPRISLRCLAFSVAFSSGAWALIITAVVIYY